MNIDPEQITLEETCNLYIEVAQFLPLEPLVSGNLIVLRRHAVAAEITSGLLGPGHRSPGPSPCHYSPECVEGVFCEVRVHGVLRSSDGFVLWDTYS